MQALSAEINKHFLAPTHASARARRARAPRYDASRRHRVATTADSTMTYCVAMRLDAGMIFASDSRTNAGVDHVATFRKMTRVRDGRTTA